MQLSPTYILAIFPYIHIASTPATLSIFLAPPPPPTHGPYPRPPREFEFEWGFYTLSVSKALPENPQNNEGGNKAESGRGPPHTDPTRVPGGQATATDCFGLYRGPLPLRLLSGHLGTEPGGTTKGSDRFIRTKATPHRFTL